MATELPPPDAPHLIDAWFDQPFTNAYPDDLKRIEMAARNAWPTLETVDIDGWQWRSAMGGSQRANSVSTLSFSGSDVDVAIAVAEGRYRDVGATPTFQITSASEPQDLEARLAARGYVRRDPCYTMVKPVLPPAHFGVKPDLTGVEWTFHASRQWMRIYESELDEARKATAPAIIERVPWPRSFFLYRKRGLSFATALAVREDGMVGIECLITRAEGRRRGAARALMTAIDVWAREEGAHTLYLQVRASNAPALALYHSLGYEAVGRYHFRKLEGAGTPGAGQAAAAQAVQAIFTSSTLPHLGSAMIGRALLALCLPATDGSVIDLAKLTDRTVLFCYPYTGQPTVPDPPGWDDIPGAHGSTAEAQGFRNLASEFAQAGIRIFGLSSQSTEWQREAVTRLGLPFPLLSDPDFQLAQALALPIFTAGDRRFYTRLTLLLEAGRISQCWYPVTDPATHAQTVLTELIGT